MAAARFNVVDKVHGPQIQWIGRQAVKSVGGHAHHLTGFDAIGYIRDHAHVRCLWIDLYDFRSQTTPPDQNLVAPVKTGTAQYPATQTIKNKPAWAKFKATKE